MLSGTPEALQERRVDLAIGASIPDGFLGEPLMQVHFVPVAHPEHPLHALGRAATLADLRNHRRLFIRETGVREELRHDLATTQRWTVTNKATSIRAVHMGLGFAWFPEESVRAELDEGHLKKLTLRDGSDRYVMLYLMFADPENAGPGARRLAEIIREATKGLRPPT